MEYIANPQEIEKKSFEIITEILGDKELESQNLNVIKRVIHTTADFDYADNLVFSENVVGIAIEALRKGASIVTDTQMVRSGINKKGIDEIGSSVECFIGCEEVAQTAKSKGVTRAGVAVEYAVENISKPIIFAVGNAPTALIKLHEMIEKGLCKPELIIAVPVGFVNVVESKELIMELDVPYIVAKGRKGGSNVAAAICNALIYDIVER